MTYRYRRLRRRHFIEGLFFHGGPLPGELMPDFDLTTLEGGSVRLSDFWNHGRPLLMALGSMTCPMTRTGLPILKELYSRFGRQVAFLSVYNREAHPGEFLPQPFTLESKVERAALFRQSAKIPWDVVVDELDGPLDRALGTVPNAVYLIDCGGLVLFRAWATNERQSIYSAVQWVLRGRNTFRNEWHVRAVPLLRGLGAMKETIAPAGRRALDDLKRELPTTYLMVQLADRLRPLPPLSRGAVAFMLPLFLGAALLYKGFSTLHPVSDQSRISKGR